jgi:hypothetical protein
MIWMILGFIVFWIICGKLDQRNSELPLDWFGQPIYPDQNVIENPKQKYIVRKCSRKRTM